MLVDICLLNDEMRRFLPAQATNGAAGLDLRASLDHEMTILSEEVKLLKTGIAINIQNPQYFGLVVPRSGLGHKNGIVLGNLVGVIDSDYQGEIKLSLWNRSKEAYTIKPFDRVAQLLILPVMSVQFQEVDQFVATSRGESGFGSTGLS